MVATANDVNWCSLAKEAMKRRASFVKLLTVIDPALKKIAKKQCAPDPEAALQDARLRLFQLVFVAKAIDTSLPSPSICSFLVYAARQEMIKTRERIARQGMDGRGGIYGRPRNERRPETRPEIQPLTEKIPQPETRAINLPYPLHLFAEYFGAHGTLDGAVECIARQQDLCPVKLARLYDKIVAQMKRNASPYPYMKTRV
jgi:hypothetical protein